MHCLCLILFTQASTLLPIARSTNIAVFSTELNFRMITNISLFLCLSCSIPSDCLLHVFFNLCTSTTFSDTLREKQTNYADRVIAFSVRFSIVIFAHLFSFVVVRHTGFCLLFSCFRVTTFKSNKKKELQSDLLLLSMVFSLFSSLSTN